MNDDEIDAIADRVVDLPPKRQVDVLLHVLEAVDADRVRLLAVVDAARAYRDLMLRDEVDGGWYKRTSEAADALFAALAQLDASPTGEDT